MEKFVIQEELKNCPGIAYYPDTNKLELIGRSIPENPELIFRRLEDWLISHFEKNNGLDVDIQLEYINSGSSKYLYEILPDQNPLLFSRNPQVKWNPRGLLFLPCYQLF